jgi:putative peptidoglycan lipid II flippase
MLLAPLFFGISGILSSIQNAYHTFLAYSLSPILYNLSIILGLIYLSPIYGIYGVAYGVVIGAFLHMAVQIPVVLRQGYRYAWILNLKRSDFIQTIKLALPRTLGLAVFQINFIVEGFIASTIAYGSLTIFRFAQDLQSFPVGIVGVSLAISSFGVLSKHAAKKQYDKIAEMVSSNIRKIIFLSIPASAGLLALRDNIISLILQYGKFSPEAALTTSLVLGIFCVSLTFLSLIPLLSRAFYALQDTKTPVKIGIITIIINLGLGLTLSYFQGIIGLALASVIAASFNFIALFSKLKTKFIQFNLKNNLLEAQYVLRVLSAAAIMGFFVFYLNQQLGQLNLLKNITQEILSWCTANPTLYFWPGLIFLQTLIATGTGIIIYGGFTLRLDENRLLLGKFGIRKTNQQ